MKTKFNLIVNLNECITVKTVRVIFIILLSMSTILYSQKITTESRNPSKELITKGLVLTKSNELTSDFKPAIGPGSAGGFPPYRLLLATSGDGTNWTRSNIVLGDRSSVADGVVLPSGRILMYYVAGAKIINGKEQNANDIVVALSDNNGKSWIYKDVLFNNIPSGATKPVDPNVVLLANGDIYMLVTIDPDQAGPMKPSTYSAISTNGGLTFNILDKVFSITNTDILDPENFRFSSNDWKLWSGGLPGKNILGLSTNNGSTFSSQGEFCLGTSDDPSRCYVVSDVLKVNENEYRIYAFGPMGTSGNYKEGICYFYSTDGGNNWNLNNASKFQVDESGNIEKGKVWAPGVLKISDNSYLMVYETEIPSSYSTTISSIEIFSNKTEFVVGESEYFQALANYSDKSKRDCSSFGTWTSSNPAVASVTSNGKVTTLAEGTTIISITYEGMSSNFIQLNVVSLPSRVTLVSPPNNSINQPLNLDLSWNEVQNASSYELQVSNNESFQGSLIFEQTTTSSTQKVTGLINSVKYYWRVRATNSAGNGPWSENYNFTTIVSLPSQVTLVSPPNNSILNSNNITLVWSESTPQVDKYWIEIAENSDFSNPQIDQNIITTFKEFTAFPNKTYWWKVKAHNSAGWGIFSDVWKFNSISVDVKDKILPTKTELYQNYPNPFNPATVIKFTVQYPETNLTSSLQYVTLKIFDITGREIKTLVNKYLLPGDYNCEFIIQNDELSSGIYFYKLNVGNQSVTKKMLLIK